MTKEEKPKGELCPKCGMPMETHREEMILFRPSRFSVDLRQIEAEDDVWELRYAEWFDMEDEGQLQRAIRNGVQMLEPLKHEGAKISVRGNKVSIKFEERIGVLTGFLAAEFLVWTKLAQMTLQELLAMASVAGLETMRREKGLPEPEIEHEPETTEEVRETPAEPIKAKPVPRQPPSNRLSMLEIGPTIRPGWKGELKGSSNLVK